MKKQPTTLQILAESLDEASEEIHRLEEENRSLRERLRTAEVNYQLLEDMSIVEVFNKYDIEVLVEIADVLAKPFGLTKSDNFRKRVREYIEKQRKFYEPSTD